MMNVRILATADNHIGYRQYGLVKRKNDMQDAFAAILDTAHKEGYDAITVSGDLLDSTRPPADVFKFLQKCQQVLVRKKIPCLVSMGNHDYSDPHWISLVGGHAKYGFQFLDNSSFDVNGVIVHGVPFTNKDGFDQGRNIPDDVDVLLMHQTFQEFASFPGDKMFTCEDLTEVPASVVVVGDIHVHEQFALQNSKGNVIHVLSPGSSEMMSSSEPGPKVAYSLEFKDGKYVKATDQLLQTRLIYRVTVKTEEDFQTMVKHLKSVEAEEPLVLLTFSTDVENVMPRLRTAVDLNKCIVKQFPVSPAARAATLNENEREANITFADIIMELLGEKTHLSSVANSLLNPKVDVQEILDEFIQNREEQLHAS